MSNPADILAVLLGHRSIRKYKPDKIERSTIETIIRAAQSASTSSYLQAYTIIGIENRETLKRLADLSDNAHVQEAPLLFVFCADLRRLEKASEDVSVRPYVETTESFLVATIDAALAAQNAAIAAEALGLGICYLGGLRNNIQAVDELLNLPHRVYPLFGMTIGYPLESPELKPRLPLSVVYHEESYDVERDQRLEAYDATIQAYYRKRSDGRREMTYRTLVARVLGSPRRTHMKRYLKEKGFMLDE